MSNIALLFTLSLRYGYAKTNSTRLELFLLFGASQLIELALLHGGLLVDTFDLLVALLVAVKREIIDY